MREIKYNSQRDNFDFEGQFPGWKQCFSTCAWMALSYYCDDIEGGDDVGLAKYLDSVEVKVGHEGIGEQIFNGVGFSSFWWHVQAAGMQKYLNDRGIDKRVRFENNKIQYRNLTKLLEDGPVILGTNKLGGLSGGHIILLVDTVLGGAIVNDPYGDATTNYADHDGEGVLYEDSFLLPHVVYKNPDKVRCIHIT